MESGFHTKMNGICAQNREIKNFFEYLPHALYGVSKLNSFCAQMRVKNTVFFAMADKIQVLSWSLPALTCHLPPAPDDLLRGNYGGKIIASRLSLSRDDKGGGCAAAGGICSLLQLSGISFICRIKISPRNCSVIAH
jgi:hypothetical protein